MAALLVYAICVSQTQTIPKWDPTKHFGKTSAQVVAMGFSKWVDLHEPRENDFDHGDIVENFTDALRIENEKYARTKSPSRQKWIRTSRRLAEDLVGCNNSLGYILMPGTRWRIEGHYSYMNAELAVRRWLSQKPPLAKDAKTVHELLTDLNYIVRVWEPSEIQETVTKKQIQKEHRALIGAHEAISKHMKLGTSTDQKVYALLLNSLGCFN